MIIDSSAIVAIAVGEPEQSRFAAAIASAEVRLISAGSWIELSAVASRRKIISNAWLDQAVGTYDLTIEPVTAEQAQLGHLAYRRYGLGTGHRARLNFGDCFAYALAMATDEPLLFKGDDFNHTDAPLHAAASYPR